MLDRRSLLSSLTSAPALFAQPDAFQAQAFVDAFDQMWSTIRDKYWDPKLEGLNWDTARLSLRPLVASAASPAEARKVLGQLMDSVRQSHFSFIPADVFRAMQPVEAVGGDAVPGFDFRLLSDGPVVTSVDPGSPAAESGIRPGWIYLPARDFPSLNPIRRHFAISGLLRGRASQILELDFEDTIGQQRHVSLRLAPAPGKMVRFGNLPPLQLDISSRRVSDAVVLRLNAFFDPEWLQKECASAIQSLASAKGMIVDLRGNLGGISGLAPAIAGWFLKSPSSLGILTMRGVSLKLYVNPRPEPYLGPLAVLIDGLSMSTAEFLAGGLKDIGRARLFGETTAGAALPSVVEKLPTGDAFQYVIANYQSASGQVLEGIGVSPHVAAPPTRASLTSGVDTAMEQALNWIRQENRNA
jgi:carboxyl-terminal processing protease